MAVLPSSLALTNVPDGSNIVAATHRNNYAAIQAEANALLAILAAGASGQVLKGVGTTLTWDYPPGYQLDYVEHTSNVSVTATSGAAANTVVTGSSVTYDGTAVWIEFYAAGFTTGTNTGQLVLYDGSTQLGILHNANQGSGFRGGAVTARVKITPSAGAHQYIVKAFVDGGTGTVIGNDGAAGDAYPLHILVTKA